MRQDADLVMLHKIADAELAAWKKTTEERLSQTDDVGGALQRSLMLR